MKTEKYSNRPAPFHHAGGGSGRYRCVLAIVMAVLLFSGMHGQLIAAASNGLSNGAPAVEDQLNTDSFLQASSSNTHDEQQLTWGEEVRDVLVGLVGLAVFMHIGYKCYQAERPLEPASRARLPAASLGRASEEPSIIERALLQALIEGREAKIKTQKDNEARYQSQQKGVFTKFSSGKTALLRETMEARELQLRTVVMSPDSSTKRNIASNEKRQSEIPSIKALTPDKTLAEMERFLGGPSSRLSDVLNEISKIYCSRNHGEGDVETLRKKILYFVVKTDLNTGHLLALCSDYQPNEELWKLMEQAIEERWANDGGSGFKLISRNSQAGESEEDGDEFADRLSGQAPYSPVREEVALVAALEKTSGYKASPEAADGEMPTVIEAPAPPARKLNRVVSDATKMRLEQEENPFL